MTTAPISKPYDYEKHFNGFPAKARQGKLQFYYNGIQIKNVHGIHIPGKKIYSLLTGYS